MSCKGHHLDDRQALSLPLLKDTIGFTTVVDESSLVTSRGGIDEQGTVLVIIWERLELYVIARGILASANQFLCHHFLVPDVSRVGVNLRVSFPYS